MPGKYVRHSACLALSACDVRDSVWCVEWVMRIVSGNGCLAGACSDMRQETVMNPQKSTIKKERHISVLCAVEDGACPLRLKMCT
eukprot:1145247-Pelagomonas_calceolata.AAC.2